MNTADDGVSGTSRIIVGVDGSPFAWAALREATRLAIALGATLDAVVAWQRSITMYDAYFPDEEDSPGAQARAIAEDAVQHEFGATPPDWFTCDVVEGDPSKVLVAASGSTTYLVVGSRGRGGITKSLLGSVSLHCASRARCPVVVVGPHASGAIEPESAARPAAGGTV